MKHSRIACFAAVSFALLRNVSGQEFVNLDFESSIPTNVITENGITFGLAIIPGWTAFLSGSPLGIIRYNVENDDGGVELVGTGAVPPIQGNYFIMLNGANLPNIQNTAGIGQTGTIPLTAQSLIFWGDVGADDVSFDGQTLPLTMTGSTENYNIYEANISAFAGKTGQLLFTTVVGGQDVIDNIQFSSSPIPEPSTLSLFSICILFLCWRMKRPETTLNFKLSHYPSSGFWRDKLRLSGFDTSPSRPKTPHPAAPPSPHPMRRRTIEAERKSAESAVVPAAG